MAVWFYSRKGWMLGLKMRPYYLMKLSLPVILGIYYRSKYCTLISKIDHCFSYSIFYIWEFSTLFIWFYRISHNFYYDRWYSIFTESSNSKIVVHVSTSGICIAYSLEIEAVEVESGSVGKCSWRCRHLKTYFLYYL